MTPPAPAALTTAPRRPVTPRPPAALANPPRLGLDGSGGTLYSGLNQTKLQVMLTYLRAISHDALPSFTAVVFFSQRWSATDGVTAVRGQCLDSPYYPPYLYSNK